MAAARYGLGGAGTTTAALAFGGVHPVVASTEEFDDPFIATATLTSS